MGALTPVGRRQRCLCFDQALRSLNNPALDMELFAGLYLMAKPHPEFTGQSFTFIAATALAIASSSTVLMMPP